MVEKQSAARGRRGEERRGEERIGEERRGKERTEEERKGEERRGEERRGRVITNLRSLGSVTLSTRCDFESLGDVGGTLPPTMQQSKKDNKGTGTMPLQHSKETTMALTGRGWRGRVSAASCVMAMCLQHRNEFRERDGRVVVPP